jgi:hypothetical protein
MIDVLYIWFAILDPYQDAFARFVTMMATFEILSTVDQHPVLYSFS